MYKNIFLFLFEVFLVKSIESIIWKGGIKALYFIFLLFLKKNLDITASHIWVIT